MSKHRVKEGYFWTSMESLPRMVLALFVCMLVSRLYEWALLFYDHGASVFGTQIVIGSLLLDLQFALVAAVPIFILFLLTQRYLSSLTGLVIPVLIAIVTFTNLLLITYFNATLTPLGPEFWAYSIDEVGDTIRSSGVLSIYSGTLIIVIVTISYGLAKLILERELPLYVTRSVYILFIPTLLFLFLPNRVSGLFSSSLQYDYAENKLSYFLTSTVAKEYDLMAAEPAPFESMSGEYPLWRPAYRGDPLGPFLNKLPEKPNIVFFIFESLGTEFLDSDARWGGFAPYLDSLKSKSLYWENGLSLTGRTFGLMPSLFGSLPFGRHGFMDLGPQYPDHQTLISVLDANGYHTSYFSGFNTYFDKLDPFLDYQGIDFMFNRELIEQMGWNDRDSGSANYWGYDDQTMLRQALAVVDTFQVRPRLEIYHTLQSHSPFRVPDSLQKKYSDKYEEILQSLDLSEERNSNYRKYRSELTTLLFTDDAIRMFMEEYRLRNKASFDRSIFIITGDHRLIPVPQPNQIARYHVPIIIYSTLLKKSAGFRSVSTHADITPTILSYLKHQYGIPLPDSAHWLGTEMDTTRAFQNTRQLALMRNKNQMIDYLDGEYYLAGRRTYQLNKGMQLTQINDDVLAEQLKSKLERFKKIDRYVVYNNRIFPGQIAYELPEKYEFITRYNSLFNRIDSLDLSTNQQFRMAQKLAFNADYEKARAICKRLLLEYPDFHDVRTLLGRTYSWDSKYRLAREQFYEVMKRDSTYYDTYNALFRNEIWAGNTETALQIINRGLEIHTDHDQFLEKKIEALITLGRMEKAKETLSHFRSKYPEHQSIEKLRNRLGM